MKITRTFLMIAAALAAWSANPTDAMGQAPPHPVLLAELIANNNQEAHTLRILAERCGGLYAAVASLTGDHTDERGAFQEQATELATLWFGVAQAAEREAGVPESSTKAVALDAIERAMKMYTNLATENYVRTGSHLTGNTFYENDRGLCNATLDGLAEKQGT